jgi:glycosyltransferase involved in cell wall biosynthesis
MIAFSIVIPCYNAANTLAQTLDSLCAQTEASFEIICVDDGSTDLTRALIQTYAERDSRIRIAYNIGKGPSSARNFGALTLARGKYIAFCDADDLWTPEKLADLAACFADEDTDAAYGQIAFFQEDPSDARVYSTVPKQTLTIPMLLAENPVCTMSNLAIRRDVFQSTSGFNEDIVHNEDLEWLIRLVGDGALVKGLQAHHTWYRTNTGGLSSDLNAMRKGRKAALKTAATFGHKPTRAANAIYDRYLARRALRLGYGRLAPLGFVLRGLMYSPLGFFSSPRRGLLTLIAAVVKLFLPRALSQSLFSR